MKIEEFLDTKWKISGLNDQGFEIESEDELTHMWLEIKDVFRLFGKLHLQYMDD